jgi:NitT/TauT family transport system ATP-binding protein
LRNRRERNAQNRAYAQIREIWAQPFTRARPGGTIARMGFEERSGLAPAIELRGVSKRFPTPDGSVFTAIADVDLEVHDGQFCAVVGPSGCGKSTTLTLVSGLERASDGRVAVHGQRVDGIGRDVGFVFQSDALLPWKTVLDNVAAGPLFRGASKSEAHERARDWLRRVGLAAFAGHHPHQLSGGMRKRVALAQSLINEPAIMLMDEPFSALDVQTRSIMSNELLTLWDQSRPSVIFVTHDLEEAIALADRVVVMTAGPGTVKEVYDIDLPRPRQVPEIRFDRRFIAIYEQIWGALRDEVKRAYARTAGALAA